MKYVSKEDLKFAYEQSIHAYQKHVERYNTWMNMYAIMTGALFVAFYSIYGKDKMFLLLITILGLLCSLCWLGAVKGHYEWMKSFIQIVKFNEVKYFGENGPFVYSKVMALNNVKPKSGNFLYGFFSTKKLTLLLHSSALWSTNVPLKEIYSLNPVPPVCEAPDITFEGMPDGVTLYVPVGSKEAYETTPGWDYFAGHIVEIDPTAIKPVVISGKDDASWYNLQGVKSSDKPTAPGIYIHGGKKVVVK